MTAPISFPTIQPAQYVPPQQGREDLGRLLLAMTEARQNLALRKQALELERQRTEASVAEQGQQTAESKARTKVLDLKREQDLEDIEAHDTAVQAVSAARMAPGGLTSTALNEAKLAAAKKNPKLATKISDAIDTVAAASEKALTDIAQRRTAQTTADIGEATKTDVISTAKDNAKLAKVNLATARTMHAIEKSKLSFVPGSLDPTSFLEHGVPAAQAYRMAGRPLPAGVDPNFVFPSAGAGGAEQRKQEALAGQATLGNALIEQAGNTPLGFKADLFRGAESNTGVTGAFTRRLLNPRLSGNERQAVQGYLLLGQAYAQNVTGATATDQQMQLFNNTIVTLDTDDPATAQQKLAVRRVLPKLIARGLSPSAIIDGLATEATRVGMAPARVKIIKAQSPFAKAYELSPQYKARQGAPATPGDAVIDPAVAAGYKAIGARP